MVRAPFSIFLDLDGTLVSCSSVPSHVVPLLRCPASATSPPPSASLFDSLTKSHMSSSIVGLESPPLYLESSFGAVVCRPHLHRFLADLLALPLLVSHPVLQPILFSTPLLEGSGGNSLQQHQLLLRAVQSTPVEVGLFTANTAEHAEEVMQLVFPAGKPFSSVFHSEHVVKVGTRATTTRGGQRGRALDSATHPESFDDEEDEDDFLHPTVWKKDLDSIAGKLLHQRDCGNGNQSRLMPFLVDDNLLSFVAKQKERGQCISVRPFHALRRWSDDDLFDRELLSVLALVRDKLYPLHCMREALIEAQEDEGTRPCGSAGGSWSRTAMDAVERLIANVVAEHNELVPPNCPWQD